MSSTYGATESHEHEHEHEHKHEHDHPNVDAFDEESFRFLQEPDVPPEQKCKKFVLLTVPLVIAAAILTALAWLFTSDVFGAPDSTNTYRIPTQPYIKPPSPIPSLTELTIAPSPAPLRNWPTLAPVSHETASKCSAHPKCSGLLGKCCPTVDGLMLDCCH